MIPITTECVNQIKDAMVTPVGVAEQFTVDKYGRRIKKNEGQHTTLPSKRTPASHLTTVSKKMNFYLASMKIV